MVRHEENHKKVRYLLYRAFVFLLSFVSVGLAVRKRF